MKAVAESLGGDDLTNEDFKMSNTDDGDEEFEDGTIFETDKVQITSKPKIEHLVYSAEKCAEFFRIYNSGDFQITEVAVKLGIKSKTATLWVRKYTEKGHLPNVERGNQRKKILDDDAKLALRNVIYKNPFISVKNIHAALKEEGISVSVAMIGSHIKAELAFFIKTVNTRIQDESEEIALQERRHFASELLRKKIDYLTNCIFIGRSDFDCLSRANGKPKVWRVSIMAAIFTTGEVSLGLGYPWERELSVKPDSVQAFMLTILRSMKKQKRNSFLIIDEQLAREVPNASSIAFQRAQFELVAVPYRLNPVHALWPLIENLMTSEELGESGLLMPRVQDTVALIPSAQIANAIEQASILVRDCLNEMQGL